jgi:phosphonopyruvate decarboxylase
MTSREVFEHREATQAGHARDFLTVGCMGHASQIALGIAAQKPDRQVYCLDGDGAVIMHLGGLAIVGAARLANYKHVVVNNGANDSVGGQPTVGFDIDLPTIAKACGYRWAESSAMVAEIPALLEQLRQTAGPALLEIRVNKGSRKNLGRPTTTPLENKRDFMAWLQAAAR